MIRLSYFRLIRFRFQGLGAGIVDVCCGSNALGERKLHILIPIAMIAAGVVWYLVQGVLGIYLRPLPLFLGNGV